MTLLDLCFEREEEQMKTELQIDLSPLTGRIYIGRAMPGIYH